MILGVGTDIIEISRMARASTSDAFLRKYFTDAELMRCLAKPNPPQHLAGCFAAKESVAKALGSGFRGFWPRDVEICIDANGKPFAQLSSRVAISHDTRLEISISHCREYATAFAFCWAVC